MAEQRMFRDSRVPEDLDTKSVADSESLPIHDIVILEKWRPPGKVDSRRVANPTPHTVLRSRDPVSLGDVGGALHLEMPPPGRRETNARSSRAGKERTRSKTSKGVQVRRRDFTVCENP